MRRKFQIFISSTYKDLINERASVINALLMANDFIPAGMECFVASNGSQFDTIKSVIDDSDAVVLIIGRRYGSINSTTGISYTEMEYDYACEMKKPIFVFCLDDNVVVDAAYKNEKDETKRNKLELFKEKAMKNRLASFYTSKDDLATKVAISLTRFKDKFTTYGWVKTDFDIEKALVENSNIISESKEKDKEIDSLRKKLGSSKCEDVEDIAGLNECFTIHYMIDYIGKQKSTISWKTIFKYMSSFISDKGINMSGFINHLKSYFVSEGDGHFQFKNEDAPYVIKDQLVAMGLLYELIDDKTESTHIYLTELGKELKFKLRIIKKGKVVNI